MDNKTTTTNPTTPVVAASGTSQQSGTDVAATSVSTTPVAPAKPAATASEGDTKPAAKKLKSKSNKVVVDDADLPDLQHTPLKRGDTAILDLGTADVKVPGTITGVYNDGDGLHYEFSVQTADAQPMRGLKAQVAKLTVPAALVSAAEGK